MDKTAWIFLAFIIAPAVSIREAASQYTMQQTYCNPVNIDYTYAIYDSHQDISYRSGADPAVVDFRNEYYMFVTRSMGYWHSTDLLNWTFIRPQRWYFQGSNAPAAHNYKDSVLYVMGHPSGSMSVLYTDDPVRGDWNAVPGILHQLQDPDLFIDDDGQAYVFWGSSPGGFMNGAGHGSTVKGPEDQYWHFATIAVTASSSLDTFNASYIADENSKTFWVAEENNDNQWLEIDLESPGEVFAIQVNYHDYRSDIYGRVPGMRHRYVIEGSADGSEWTVLVDRENSFDDVPNDYVELGKSELVRYIRFSNIEVPMQNLAISGLRVFGTGTGEKPGMVEDFRVIRHDDRRDATITWEGQDNAQGYNIRWGIAPDKLYSTWMIYDDDSHLMKSLTTRQSYYFAIEAFNENGISELSDIVRAE